MVLPLQIWQRLTGKSWLHPFTRPSLEPSSLNTRRFLFRLPESLSKWREQVSLGFAPFCRKRFETSPLEALADLDYREEVVPNVPLRSSYQ